MLQSLIDCKELLMTVSSSMFSGEISDPIYPESYPEKGEVRHCGLEHSQGT